MVLFSEVIGSLDDTIIDVIMDSLGSAIPALTSLWALQEWTRPGVSVVNSPIDRSRLTQSNTIDFWSIAFHQMDIFLGPETDGKAGRF
ncbi:hypothetical protein [Microcoleus sp.]|uniref:hypothetical protein n=1 Tax=Microcoleus sp. TaxID=44472 RepID=UPI003593C291